MSDSSAMFSGQDLVLILFLAFLEGILSIDNALVLALLARHLPERQQRKALTYGLVGAVFFRLASLLVIRLLMKWIWIKYLGGAYLIFIALRHLFRRESAEKYSKTGAGASQRSFWRTVLVIEIMDIAFAVDSILAAVAVTPKFWIVFIGGFLGVILVRFAATIFLKLLNRFPGFEATSYVLILIIGLKLIVEALHLPRVRFESVHDTGFWVFWSLMGATLLSGFRPKPRH